MTDQPIYVVGWPDPNGEGHTGGTFQDSSCERIDYTTTIADAREDLAAARDAYEEGTEFAIFRLIKVDPDDGTDYERWWRAMWMLGDDEPELTLTLVDRNGPNYHPKDPELGIYLPESAKFDFSGAGGPPNGVSVLSRDRGTALDRLTAVCAGFGVDTSEWAGATP